MKKMDDKELMRICREPFSPDGTSVFGIFAAAAYNDCINGLEIDKDKFPAVMLPYVARIYGMAA